MNILQINSSARREGSHSTRLADAHGRTHPRRQPRSDADRPRPVATPHPQLDEATLGALFTPADKRTPEQAARVALDDALIAEIQAADVVVLGVPMYNFGVSAQLKNWIDAIARARSPSVHGQRSGRPAEGQEGVRGADARRHVPQHAGATRRCRI